MRGARLAQWWVALSDRRAGTVLLLGALVAAAGGLGTVRLYSDLRSDVAELLPEDARSARDTEAVTRRVGGWAEETVALHGPDPAALRAFADELAPRLEAIPELVDSVEYRIDEVRRFFEPRRWLFPQRQDLEALHDVLKRRIRYELHAAMPVLSAPSGPPPDVAAVVERMRAGLPSSELLQRFPDGYYAAWVTDPSGQRTHALVLRVRLAGNPNDYSRISGLHQAVRRTALELKAQRPDVPVSIALGGYVASTVFEHDGLAEDLVLATALVMLAIALVIALYYRTAKAIMVVGAPLLVGTLATFGMAEVLIGHVNSNTAFLGSIVIGNGINVGLILFARYAEERRVGAAALGAMTTAVSTTWLATLTAALAAGVAYASLVVTEFRGFNQFGVIGGVGMAFCWLATYALMPALVLAWERRWTLISPAPRAPRAWVMEPVARLVERWPRAVVACFLVLMAGAAFFAVRFAQDPLEYDFGKLRDSRALDDGGPAFWEDAVFGGHLDPCVVLAKDEAEARAVTAAFEGHRQANPGGTLGAAVSVATFVPTEQQEKLPIIAALRELADPSVLELAPVEHRATLAAAVPPADLQPFTSADLPLALRRRLTETDGTLGTPVLVYPASWVQVWNGHHAVKVAEELRAVALPRPDLPMASSLLVFADVLDAVVRDGPKATGLALVGVVALVLGLFVAGVGWRRGLVDTGLVLASLFSGVLLFAGLAGLLGLKLSLLSFIAVPITFGIGADYAANLVQRRRVGGTSLGTALRTTGGAVALCSLTTVIGYSSLLVAHNQALVSFGVLANLGEVACLLTALLLVPAALVGRSKET